MITYADLVNVNGTMYNKITGKGYSSPDELAKDMGLSIMPENWHLNPAITKSSTPPVPAGTPPTTPPANQPTGQPVPYTPKPGEPAVGTEKTEGTSVYRYTAFEGNVPMGGVTPAPTWKLARTLSPQEEAGYLKTQQKPTAVGEIGTWIDSTTQQGYSGPKKNPNDIPADPITGKPLETLNVPVKGTTTPIAGRITYNDLVNVNGGIYNAKTGKPYGENMTPEQAHAQLAADLGILPHQIEWAKIPKGTTPPTVTPETPGVSPIETDETLNKIVEMTKGGASWDEIMNYLASQKEAGKSDTERRQEIYDKYGITNLETTAFQLPERTFEQIYAQAYNQAGLSDVKTELTKAQTELDKATADYNSGVAEINKNPWKSEAGRVGSVRRITDEYEKTASRLEAKITRLTNTYERGVEDAKDVATRTLSELEKGTVLDQQKLEYVVKRAEADIEAAKLTEQETVAKEMYRYFPEYVKNLAKEKGTPQLKQNASGEYIWIYPDGSTVKTGIVGEKSSTGGAAKYDTALRSGINNLYAGDYGKDGAREKLIANLKGQFPGVDVATDIYTRVPDGYEQYISAKAKVTTMTEAEMAKEKDDIRNQILATDVKKLKDDDLLDYINQVAGWLAQEYEGRYEVGEFLEVDDEGKATVVY